MNHCQQKKRPRGTAFCGKSRKSPNTVPSLVKSVMCIMNVDLDDEIARIEYWLRRKWHSALQQKQVQDTRVISPPYNTPIPLDRRSNLFLLTDPLRTSFLGIFDCNHILFTPRITKEECSARIPSPPRTFVSTFPSIMATCMGYLGLPKLLALMAYLYGISHHHLVPIWADIISKASLAPQLPHNSPKLSKGRNSATL